MKNPDFKLILRIVYTVKHVISKILNKISLGFLLKEEEGPIIQTCKFFVALFTFILTTSISYAKDSSNKFGDYLEWIYAKEINDVKKLKKKYKHINLSNVSENTLEELLFESIIFDDWNTGKEISLKLIELNKENTVANFYLLVENFVEKKKVNLSTFSDSNNQRLDANFFEAILIWIDGDKNVDYQNKLEECIPLLCVHYGMSAMLNGEKKKAQEFFQKIEDQKFSSARVKELQLYASIKFNKTKKAKELIESLSYKDLNMNNYDFRNISDNLEILNPVLTERDGLAEVFYNISSWYYQKDLYKFSIFFGKLSLRLRKDFNAMRLLLASSLEIMDMEDSADKILSKTKTKNPYFMKFLKLRISLNDKLEKQNKIKPLLEELTKNHPKNWELKILLADIYRIDEKYKESINLYSQIIDDVLDENKWSIFYSRGIAYERSNKWKKAEEDLQMAMNLKPNDPYVINYLAYSWLDRKMNIDVALNLLEKAVELEPTDGYILDSLGWAYYLSNSFEQSIYFLEKAVSFLPNDPTLNDHLGDAYWKSGRFEEAKSQWERVLIIDPKFKTKDIVKKKIEFGI